MRRPFLAAGLVALCLLLTGCPQIFDALVNSSNPHSLSASRGRGTDIRVSWMAPTFEEGDTTTVTEYRVYRDDSLVDTTTSTSWTDSAATEATEYTYSVKAELDTEGVSSTSGSSNSDSGWYVPAQTLKFDDQSPGWSSQSGTGWFETLVVKNWRYHFSGDPGTLQWAESDSPWDATSVSGSGSWTWTAPLTGKVWLKFGAGTDVRAWYD